MKKIQLIIHDVRSIHNVASLFRTADGAGVSHIFLTGYTPGPIDRFGRVVRAFSKVSLGAEHTVPWEHADVHAVLHMLGEKKVCRIALEQHQTAVPYTTFTAPQEFALLVGNEVGGIPDALITQTDAVIDIPMRGKKESLNVAIATGIALYALSRPLHQ
jgi:23S rRNA (guanosine2251-2'-O)-methyltransferase